MISDVLVFRAPQSGSDPLGVRSTITQPRFSPAARQSKDEGRPPPTRRPGRWRLTRLAVAGLFVLALGTLACAGTRPNPLPHVGAAWQPGELVPIDTHGRGLLLVRPDHQLGRYDKLMIEEVGFRYSNHQRWLSFREEDRVRSMISSAVRGTQDSAIGMAAQPGPCVLSVRFYVTDLELHDPGYKSISTTSFIRSFGEATMVMELRDSVTNQPLARFLQRRELGSGTGLGGTSTSIRRLQTVVGVAMREMGSQLQNLTPPTSGGWDGECHGGMTRVAFGSH